MSRATTGSKVEYSSVDGVLWSTASLARSWNNWVGFCRAHNINALGLEVGITVYVAGSIPMYRVNRDATGWNTLHNAVDHAIQVQLKHEAVEQHDSLFYGDNWAELAGQYE